MGRSGVYDCSTGALIARDPDDDVGQWMTDNNQFCTGIGPLAGTAVRVTSIWGGGLIRVSEDGWSIDIVPVDWPEQRVILQPPACDVMTEHLAANCVLVVVPETEVRATGFDPT